MADKETSVCCYCKEEKPASDFDFYKGRLRSDCRACKSIYFKEYSKKKLAEYKKWLNEKTCCSCGFSHPDALEVHHLAKEYKRFGSSQDKAYNVQDVEFGFAVVLCASCHLIFHSAFGGRNAPFPVLTKEETAEVINRSRSKY